MDTAEQIGFTVETFQKVLNVEKHRLAVGVAMRNYINERLGAGVEPEHYRMDWMRKGITRIIRDLEIFGREFNTANPTDKFSTADMIDVANNVVATLTNYLTPED